MTRVVFVVVVFVRKHRGQRRIESFLAKIENATATISKGFNEHIRDPTVFFPESMKWLSAAGCGGYRVMLVPVRPPAARVGPDTALKQAELSAEASLPRPARRTPPHSGWLYIHKGEGVGLKRKRFFHFREKRKLSEKVFAKFLVFGKNFFLVKVFAKIIVFAKKNFCEKGQGFHEKFKF
jgi:hypothetical protein